MIEAEVRTDTSYLSQPTQGSTINHYRKRLRYETRLAGLRLVSQVRSREIAVVARATCPRPVSYNRSPYNLPGFQ